MPLLIKKEYLDRVNYYPEREFSEVLRDRWYLAAMTCIDKSASTWKRFFSSTQQTAGGSLPQMPNMTHIRRFYKKVDVIEHPLSS